MSTHVALLRGINVGGHHKVPMAELRALLGELGLDAPGTLGASGNAWFDTDPETDVQALQGRLAEALHGRFGFAIPTVVRRVSELHAVAGRPHPFAADGVDPKFLHVVFLDAPPTGTLDRNALPPDLAEVRGRELYVRYTRGSARSKLTLDRIERWLGVTATGRNWNSVRKLAARTGLTLAEG